MEIPTNVYLSPRQADVLELYCQDLNQPQIAKALGITQQLVCKCLKIIFAKIHRATMGEPCDVQIVTGQMLRQRITIYHKPTSTGARLAAFDLKHGCCSVTRPAQTML